MAAVGAVGNVTVDRLVLVRLLVTNEVMLVYLILADLALGRKVSVNLADLIYLRNLLCMNKSLYEGTHVCN